MDVETLHRKYTALEPELTERSRRLWAATEARALGHGGIALVERATEKDPTLLPDLESLVEPTASGDPDSPLRWTSKSVRKLADELTTMGHEVSHKLVADLLHELRYSLQANRKTREGSHHPDRDAQFGYINDMVARFQDEGQPVISVDTKKKELIGDFKNPGREWRPKGSPERVRVHDFLIPEQGKAIPYGVYDLTRNQGWVSVGVTHDTASFAVNAIRSWWKHMGRPSYRDANALLITADAGGSNGPRVRLWKWELQRFANRTGLSSMVCHVPPCTRKWNKIEHRLCPVHQTANNDGHRLLPLPAIKRRGTHLSRLATCVSRMGSNKTKRGLRVRSEIDKTVYAKGVKITDRQMANIKLESHTFHGDWNYTIRSTRR